jgi:hypothetical protein
MTLTVKGTGALCATIPLPSGCFTILPFRGGKPCLETIEPSLEQSAFCVKRFFKNFGVFFSKLVVTQDTLSLIMKYKQNYKYLGNFLPRSRSGNKVTEVEISKENKCFSPFP